MKKMKEVDYKILAELMKNSKISDRQLARKLGVSQPTVTRRRASLEKELIDGYTAIPKWQKLGYEIFAITFVKSKVAFASAEKKEAAIKRSQEWVMKQPNVVLAGGGRGCGYDAFMESFHRNYTNFVNFITDLNTQMGDVIADSESFVVALDSDRIVKPFHLKYLGEAK